MGGGVKASREKYGERSSARGLMCTNWGGGEIVKGLVPIASKAWNLEG